MDIGNLEQFSPSAINVFTTDRGYRYYSRNPTDTERKLAIYVPIYTLYRRYRNELDISLNIQFSIPKLLYKNNFQEVSEYDFENILDKLELKLRLHSFNISRERLINAKVVAIHFSKNILLSEGLNCPMVLNQLKKALDTNLKQDFAENQFKNGGQIIHIHNKDSEFAIYDKVRELQQAKTSKEKSVDKQVYTQLNLLDELLNNNYLRLEFRMTGQKAMKRKIQRYATEYSEIPLTFKELFNRGLSQTMLTSFWNREIKDKYISITWKPEDFYEKMISIKNLNPQLSERQLINTSFMQGVISDRGIQALRSTMGWYGKKSYKWSSYKKLLKNLKVEDNRVYIINDIDTQLQEFRLFREIPKELKQLTNI
jgi:hypothetical protein